MAPLRILISDDHELVRQGVRSILQKHPGWEVCGEAIDGQDTVKKALELRPDVIIIDIGMPKLNGVDALREILHTFPETTILVLTIHKSEQLIRDVMEAGASGYLLKSSVAGELATAIQSLLKQKKHINSEYPDKTGPPGAFRPSISFAYDELTARERQVLQLLAEGNSIKKVAAQLGVSVKTADTHRTNIMRKLGLHSISDLVLFAARNNIISLGPSN